MRLLLTFKFNLLSSFNMHSYLTAEIYDWYNAFLISFYSLRLLSLLLFNQYHILCLYDLIIVYISTTSHMVVF